MLAGVSAEYYTRLERGNLGGVSESVLEALSRALQLSDAERSHLFDLARTARSSRVRPKRRAASAIRPSVQRVLDALTGAPAFVLNGRLDILAANQLGTALYSPLFANPVRPVNHARFVFLDDRSHQFWADWNKAATDTVGILRQEAGRDPYDPALSSLIGELSTRSEAFRVMWAAHEVRLHLSGSKHFAHPLVGQMTLSFDSMPLPSDNGLTLLVYTAEAGTRHEDALRLLASYSPTESRENELASEQTPTLDGE